MSTVTKRFWGAFRNHLMSWSSLWDLALSVGSVVLLTRSLPSIANPATAINGQPEPEKDIACWLCVLALLLASLVSYRRANALRAEGAWTNVTKEQSHGALLWGELLCAWAVTILLLLPTIVYLAATQPQLLAPSAAAAATLASALVLITLMASAVFYFLSAYVLGAEGFSVLAITIVILGFSRSDVPREVARTVEKIPALAALPISDVVSIATRVFTPPIEETIKAAIDGSFAGRELFVAQAVLQVVFLIALSGYVVSRWGSHDLEARRELARSKRSGRTEAEA